MNIENGDLIILKEVTSMRNTSLYKEFQKLKFKKQDPFSLNSIKFDSKTEKNKKKHYQLLPTIKRAKVSLIFIVFFCLAEQKKYVKLKLSCISL